MVASSRMREGEESPSSIGQRTPLSAGPPPQDMAERISPPSRVVGTRQAVWRESHRDESPPELVGGG